MALSNSNAVISLASKFRGCLMGSHIGDCLGAPFEGDYPVSKKTVLDYFGHMLKDKSPNEGAKFLTQPYTDDTAMTFSVAESLIEKNGFDPIDMAKRFVEEYFEHPRRGYGANVVDVFGVLKQINFVDVFEPARLQFSGSGSYGNGAAMRIAPMSLYYHNQDEECLKKFAKECSLITHTHQNGYNGAILQCLAIRQALNAKSSTDLNPVQFTDKLLQKMKTIEQEIQNVSSLEDKRPFCNSLQKIKDLFENNSTLSAQSIGDILGNYVTAHRSVPTAIYCFLRSSQPLEDLKTENSFVRAIVFAVSVGGDTDTIAAMTGSIAGAYYGHESIPPSFLPRCEAIEKSLKLADVLLEMVTKQSSNI